MGFCLDVDHSVCRTPLKLRQTLLLKGKNFTNHLFQIRAIRGVSFSSYIAVLYNFPVSPPLDQRKQLATLANASSL